MIIDEVDLMNMTCFSARRFATRIIPFFACLFSFGTLLTIRLILSIVGRGSQLYGFHLPGLTCWQGQP